ncbi:MAG: hypothetical protein ACRD5K_18180 [Candidatus Acidiferrales bacterium]
MIYDPRQFRRKIEPNFQALTYGIWILMLILGLGFLTKEIQRVMSAPVRLKGVLYLGLLLSVGLLAAGWKWVTQVELGLLCEFLSPYSNYKPPDDTILVGGMSIVLGLLLLTASSPRAFGVVYLIYSAANLVAWLRFRRQLQSALVQSRDRLEREQTEPADKKRVFKGALNRIQRYYFDKWQTPRLAIVLTLAIVGLLAAYLGASGRDLDLTVAAYVCDILSVVVLEVILMVMWRTPFYSDMRLFSAKLGDPREDEDPIEQNGGRSTL